MSDERQETAPENAPPAVAAEPAHVATTERAVPVSELGLSVRVTQLLSRASVATLDELLDRAPGDLGALPGFGPRALDEVRKALGERGLALRGCDVPAPRDAAGHWLAGASGNPGGTKPGITARRRRLHEIALEEVSDDDWRTIVRSAVKGAREGNREDRAYVTELCIDMRERDAVVAGAAVEIRITRTDDWRVGSADGDAA